MLPRRIGASPMVTRTRRPAAPAEAVPGTHAAAGAAHAGWQQHLSVAFSGTQEGSLAEILGVPHYSYRFVESAFQRMFEAQGVPVTRLRMPEYYATPEAFPPGVAGGCGDPQRRIAHLIFRSTEDIRLLKPATNIAVFPWEFDVISDTTLPEEHPFRNQKRMLSLCDEVWVLSRYTEAVLRAHGIGNVHTVPAPIRAPQGTVRERHAAVAALGELKVCPVFINYLLPDTTAERICAARQTSLRRWLAGRLQINPGARIYLAVLNPEDFRKNIGPMVRGFHYFSQQAPGSVLIIKALTSASRYSLPQVVCNVIRSKMPGGTVLDCEQIAVCNAFMSDTELSWLYRLADCYLCTSIAEGQNMPLLEAMRHGAVPVTTSITSMLDYIDPDNAVVIQTRRQHNENPHLAACATGKPFDIDYCSYVEIYQALCQSAALSPAQFAAKGAAAKKTVAEAYAPEVVWRLASARLGLLAANTASLAAE